jgi:hypothetical protein
LDGGRDGSDGRNGDGYVHAIPGSVHHPADPNDMPNLSIVQTIIEDQRAITGAGVFNYDFLLGYQYLQWYHMLGVGAAGSDGLRSTSCACNRICSRSPA